MRLRGLTLAFLTACTVAPGPPDPGPSAPGSPSPTASPGALLSVVATASGPGALEDRPHLDGMRLAEREINERDGVLGLPLRLEVVDDARAGTAAGVGRALGRTEPPALVVVGPGEAVLAHRTAIQADRRPVMLLGGDLYTSRGLFPQVFQSAPPMRWQARVIARYLARDRRHDGVVIAAVPGREPQAAVVRAAARAEGLRTRLVGSPPPRIRGDALVALVDGPGLDPLLAAIRAAEDPPQLVLPSDLLRTDLPALPPGTVAPGTYAWAPWARPIPRVREFRDAFEEAHGRPPVGAEQEGYDAIRLLVRALEETEGRGGNRLVRALEGNRPKGPAISGLPLVLGPDDHTMTDETWVGLFAVAGPDEEAEPWLRGVPWRPIIRTFTYDGERTVLHERDRRVFFPSWRRNRPSPKFHRSRWGIATRAGRDPLH